MHFSNLKDVHYEENMSMENIPDECFPDLKDMCTDIIQKYNNIKNDLLKEYDNIMHLFWPGDFFGVGVFWGRWNFLGVGGFFGKRTVLTNDLYA